MADTATLERPKVSLEAEHFDVLIVGAGISGIGGAYHLTQERPDTSFVILESLETFGGTWWQHKYPGTRSDSDLYTFGYRFKPWIGAPIASREEILKYMGEVIEENDLGKHIRYGHKIRSATWSSTENQWTVVAANAAGETKTFTCTFLWMCSGYYRMNEGHTPDWPGMADFKGQIVHPQTWPEDLDYKGKRVIIIGSGATAATLAPAMAADCKHITVLQRSPTYFIPGVNQNELANTLRELKVPEEWVHEIVRRQILANSGTFAKRAFEDPEQVTKELLAGVKMFLGDDYDINKHFTPHYRPWRQRIAFIPGGDMFLGIKNGLVTMVTDHIEKFTEKGILLKSGDELEADIIVTATGFNMNVLGDIDFVIDGKPLNFHDTVTYRGMMFTGVPNLVWVFGYFRASWTLRSDIISDFVVRLLGHMDERQAKRVEVGLRPEDKDMKLGPFIDPENFNPNYLTRSMHLLPQSGDKPEWKHSQDYNMEREALPKIDLDAAEFRYA
ncbi:MAG: NAD(P)/FAD-dependent oxidoreductase [Caulobacteraceae bacterium]